MAPGEEAPLPTHDAIEPALARWREAERAIQRGHLSLAWHAASPLGVGAGRPLQPETVRAAASWRRAQQLVTPQQLQGTG